MASEYITSVWLIQLAHDLGFGADQVSSEARNILLHALHADVRVATLDVLRRRSLA